MLGDAWNVVTTPSTRGKIADRMSIHFIANDPSVAKTKLRRISPRPNRPAHRAGFRFVGAVPEALYDPKSEPAEFLFWQCREAAIAALDGWEAITGRPFVSWQSGKKIDLLSEIDDSDVNAYYTRDALEFARLKIGRKTYRVGSSTDVVAHEVGHGIFDAVRPELWDSHGVEIGAFHESFGDCVAILTALQDTATRKAVVGSLGRRNFVETWGENMAAGSKALDPDHNASAPRRAHNDFAWQRPSTLPQFDSSGDGPGRLINESHSFAQVFTGCFYDSIVAVFVASAGGTAEQRLQRATAVMGALLAKAIVTAPAGPRFFRAVGQAMVDADARDNEAANRDAIRDAFARHAIVLDDAVLAPDRSIRGARRGRPAAASRAVEPAVAVPLDHLDPRLQGVVARAPGAAAVRELRRRRAADSPRPQDDDVAADVDTFVQSLLRTGAIDFGATPDSSPRRRGIAPIPAAPVRTRGPLTHVVKMIDGVRVLVRIRFACKCRAQAP